MNESEFLQTTIQITQLTSSTEYRKALLLARRKGPKTLAEANENSEEYASIRLLIGTWEDIAPVCAGFSAKQRTQFFRRNPVSLVWQYLEPATKIIRDATDERFASDFEALNNQYQKWSRSKDGEQYTTVQLQAINGRFLV
jgi:hypothetical protein